LEKVRDYLNEPLHDYIRRFSKTWISIPNINNDEAISTFIRGLRKRPDSYQDLLMVAKKWADTNDTDQ
jgi:hypothetical protein